MHQAPASELVTIYGRAAGVVFDRLDDELLAIDREGGWCYSLNETAGRVWELLERPARAADLCAALAEEYEVAGDECREEVLSLLEELREYGIVERHGTSVG
ncbi:MAG TPA: HPr-rel-A system PqqD family peptide chaperone [Armatimonadota bacterium]|jgi:PqqD family protein of HPr-rel-A system